VFPLHVPPLRERREDIPVLAAHFADVAARRLGLASARVTDRAKALLSGVDWPGNVRELENVVSRGMLRASFGKEAHGTVTLDDDALDIGPTVRPPDAGAKTGAAADDAGPLNERVERFEREAILAAVARHHGNWAAAARELGLHRSNLHHRARRLGLKAQ
jgi:anaerobic nitric oxide reductase transcription regulator